VLELSSFQLETIDQFHADIAVCLNITPDHLDRHYTLERYAAAKGRLFENQAPKDFAVLNADDAFCVGFASDTAARTLWFSLSHPVAPGLWLENGTIVFDGQPLISQAEVPLRGVHNIENAMAASAAARLAGASTAQIAGAIATFPGVEHRLEFVRERNGVKYYNDSKATNVDATIKALDSFDGGLWIILGGKDKNSDYTLLTGRLQQKARGVLLIGAAASIITAQLGSSVPLVQCGTLEAAVDHASRNAAPGETVLLSPACASFDQFDNYEQRGRAFKAAVNAL
ncbi:MAG: UDP-N-acetylmuramoyl-L-alanine--D-glutamate ligase, partial [Bryobacteraceae bacterium]